jgi:hypothetical protein
VEKDDKKSRGPLAFATIVPVVNILFAGQRKVKREKQNIKNRSRSLYVRRSCFQPGQKARHSTD